MFKLSVIVLLTFLSGLIAACGPWGHDQKPSATFNVFGRDNREIADAAVMPFRALGRIDSGCTAFLIGPSLAATAAHCVVDSSTGALKSVIGSFNTQYDADKKPQKSARIVNAWVGSFNPEEFRSKDWALLELAKPLGDELGFLQIRSTNFTEATLPFAVAAAGYQMGFADGVKPGVDTECLIRSIDDKERLLNDCDSSPGISGGPLFKGPLEFSDDEAVVVAMAVSEFRSTAQSTVRRDTYDPEYANAAISMADLKTSLLQIESTQIGSDSRSDTNNAFHLAIADTQPAAVTRYFIQLRSTSSWGAGTFRDDLGQILCSRPSADCQGIYDSGTRVVLSAPATILVYRQQGVFQRWVCSDSRENFPGTNVCMSNGRDCTVVMRSDLICSGMYQ